MIILKPDALPAAPIDSDFCALNAVWCGGIKQQLALPNYGYIFAIFPLSRTPIACADVLILPDQYLLLTRTNELYTLQNVAQADEATVLVLMLSPGFVVEMADFVGVPADFQALLHAVPLPQGDDFSGVLRQLAGSLTQSVIANELFMEVVGQLLRLLRLRNAAVMGMNKRKQNTVNDLVPRLLQARQFIEAHFAEAIKTQDVAAHVMLSEYHFARLFKAAFGVTVHQYVMRLRLNQARYLLEVSEQSVTEIALNVGYNSLSAFIHAFGNYVGLTPSAYQARFA